MAGRASGSQRRGDRPRWKAQGMSTILPGARSRDTQSCLKQMSSLTDASTRHMLNAVPTRRLLPSAEDKYKYDEVEGFLRLRSLRRRENDQSYRRITASKHDVDSDASASSEAEDSETSEDNSDTTPMTSLQATLKSLEKKIAADPSSISAWLSLLSHTLSTTSMTSKNASKARSEIAVSVLSRALSAHPSNVSSKTLRLRYLKAGEEIWHESKLRSEWEEALRIGGTEIWMEWLNWKIRKCTKGTDQIVDDARRALHSIGEDEVGKLRILWRTAVGFRDAGLSVHVLCECLMYRCYFHRLRGTRERNNTGSSRAVRYFI